MPLSSDGYRRIAKVQRPQPDIMTGVVFMGVWARLLTRVISGVWAVLARGAWLAGVGRELCLHCFELIICEQRWKIRWMLDRASFSVGGAMIPDFYEDVVDGEKGRCGCGSAGTRIVTHRTLGDDELDIWEEGMRKHKTKTKNTLGSA
jgi:hypothetical protein